MPSLTFYEYQYVHIHIAILSFLLIKAKIWTKDSTTNKFVHVQNKSTYFWEKYLKIALSRRCKVHSEKFTFLTFKFLSLNNFLTHLRPLHTCGPPYISLTAFLCLLLCCSIMYWSQFAPQAHHDSSFNTVQPNECEQDQNSK